MRATSPPEEPAHAERFLGTPWGNGCREASLVILASRTNTALERLFRWIRATWAQPLGPGCQEWGSLLPRGSPPCSELVLPASFHHFPRRACCTLSGSSSQVGSRGSSWDMQSVKGEAPREGVQADPCASSCPIPLAGPGCHLPQAQLLPWGAGQLLLGGSVGSGLVAPCGSDPGPRQVCYWGLNVCAGKCEWHQEKEFCITEKSRSVAFK